MSEAMAEDDDCQSAGELAKDIASDRALTDMAAIRQLLALMIDNQDLMVAVLISIDENLDMRKVVKQ